MNEHTKFNWKKFPIFSFLFALNLIGFFRVRKQTEQFELANKNETKRISDVQCNCTCSSQFGGKSMHWPQLEISYMNFNNAATSKMKQLQGSKKQAWQNYAPKTVN